MDRLILVCQHCNGENKRQCPYDMKSQDVCELCGRNLHPIPMILTCIVCGARHIDEGDFAHKHHHTHACQNCGVVWRPSKEFTRGVKFLPGYKSA